jgi:hypothetical protein
VGTWNQYQLWYEQWPAQYVQWVSVTNTLNVGDSIYFHVTHGSSSSGYHYVDSTRGWQTQTIQKNDLQPFDGSSAEVIVERTSVNGVPADLRHFTTPISWQLSRAGVVNGTVKTLDQYQPLAYFMTADGSQTGRLLAQPSPIGSGGTFSVTHGPYCE